MHAEVIYALLLRIVFLLFVDLFEANINAMIEDITLKYWLEA